MDVNKRDIGRRSGAKMTRCRLNFHLLTITLVMVPLTTGSAICAQRWQQKRISKKLLELAQHEEDKQRWLKAAGYLERYLRVVPHDPDVESRLALGWAKGAYTPQDRQHAIKMCYRTLAHEHPAHAFEVRSHLADLLLESHRLLEAEEEAKRILAEQSENALARRVKAMAQFIRFRNGALAGSDWRGQNIIQEVECARRLNPTNADLAEAAASIYRSYPELVKQEFPSINDEERKEKSDACLDLLVRNAPTDPAVYLARFRHRLRHKLPNAEVDLYKALHVGSREPDVLLAAAKHALQRANASCANKANEEKEKNYCEARDAYRVIVSNKLIANSVEPYLGLGDSLRGLGAFDEAIAAWGEGLNEFTQPSMRIQFRARIADCLIEQGRLEQAEINLADIDRLLGKTGASVTKNQRINLQRSQDLRRASWHLLRSEPLNAVALLQGVIALDMKGSHEGVVAAFAWKELGRAYGMLEEWDQSAVAYDRARAANPDDVLARLAASHAWLHAGRPELAADRADMAVLTKPTFDAWFMLAVAHFRNQMQRPVRERSWERFEEALEALENSGLIHAGAWRATLLKAEYVAQRSTDRIDDALRLQNVANILHEGEERFVDVGEFWIQSILLYEKLGMANEAHRALAEMRTQSHSPTDVAMATGRLASLQKDHHLARHTLEQALLSARYQDRERVKRALYTVVAESNDQGLLHSLLVDELTSDPQNTVVLRRLAALALERRDFKNLHQWEKDLAKSGPLGRFWSRYYSAWRQLLTASSPIDESLRLTLDEQGKLAAERPALPGLLILQGMIQDRVGSPAAAAFEQTSRVGESDRRAYQRRLPVRTERGPATDVGDN